MKSGFLLRGSVSVHSQAIRFWAVASDTPGIDLPNKEEIYSGIDKSGQIGLTSGIQSLFCPSLTCAFQAFRFFFSPESENWGTQTLHKSSKDRWKLVEPEKKIIKSLQHSKARPRISFVTTFALRLLNPRSYSKNILCCSTDHHNISKSHLSKFVYNRYVCSFQRVTKVCLPEFPKDTGLSISQSDGFRSGLKLMLRLANPGRNLVAGLLKDETD